jgi:hypothetical protein
MRILFKEKKMKYLLLYFAVVWVYLAILVKYDKYLTVLPEYYDPDQDRSMYFIYALIWPLTIPCMFIAMTVFYSVKIVKYFTRKRSI